MTGSSSDCSDYTIRTQKPPPLWIIVPAPQVVQFRLFIPYISTVPERIQPRQLLICSRNRSCVYGISPRVVFVLDDLLSGRIYDRYDVALQVVDVPI